MSDDNQEIMDINNAMQEIRDINNTLHRFALEILHKEDWVYHETTFRRAYEIAQSMLAIGLSYEFEEWKGIEAVRLKHQQPQGEGK